MLNIRLNPFASILILLTISLTGLYFVLHEIGKQDLAPAGANISGNEHPPELDQLRAGENAKTP